MPAHRPGAPRSPTLLLVCLLALATGSALFGAGTTLSLPPARPDPGNGAAGVALARAFYAAANATLASGDPAALDAVVADDLVEHPPRPGGVGGRAGLVAALRSRRAAFPGLRLVVEDAHASGDHVAVRVRAEGPATGGFLWLPVPAALGAWGPLDLLRLADGKVAERWTSGTDAVLFAPLGPAVPLAGLPDAPLTVPIRRLTWEPGAALPVAATPAAWVLLVEAGDLAVTAEAAPSLARHREPDGRADGGTPPPEAIGPGRTLGLGPGEVLTAAPGAGFVVRNPGRVPATALLIAPWAPTPRPPNRQPTEGELAAERAAGALGLGTGVRGELRPASGVRSQVVTTVLGVEAPPGSWLAAGRVVLSPGATLALPGGGGPLVAAVEAGRLDLTTAGGRAWVTGADGRGRPAGERATLAAGDGVVLGAGTGAELRGAGDEAAELVVVRLLGAQGGPLNRG